MNEIIIISLGGSLIVPEGIDTVFLDAFKRFIFSRPERFVIITGGGRTARTYQAAIKAMGDLNSEDADWIGIHATRLNAHLIRTIFRNYANPKLVCDPRTKVSFKEKILVAAGWEPGFSTDYDAVLLAKQLKVKKLINLSNIDYVYSKDPNKYADAKRIEEINWKDFRKIVGDKWDPGLNTPFDPVASKEAEKLKLEVAIMNGRDFANVTAYLDGKKFKGTIIHQ
ncbi:MAG: UMP kinase [Candidatus Woesearchaeota archaeon]